MEKLEFNKGQFVFKAGDSAGYLFLLIKGEIGIFLPTNETNSPNFPVGENEIFGEMGVIEDTLRSAGARCMTDCVVISLSKQEYEKKLNESDPFIKGLLRLLSIRLREMTKPKTLGSK
tara:strand:- start:24384 stop:24737 length:354 start_codon:yes stop_codon:yes gene_type:complete